jgi:hypothetical protein
MNVPISCFFQEYIPIKIIIVTTTYNNNRANQKLIITVVNRNQMSLILGSIDNASTGGSMNHLIFTSNEILQFQVMEDRERLATQGSSTEDTALSPLRRHSPMLDRFHRISSICLERGKNIERTLDDHLGAEKGDCKSMNYSAITDVVLSGENEYSLHSLSFKYKGQEIKYLLLYEGGKVTDDVFASYKNTLDMAFPNNWRLNKGVRIRNLRLPALKIGVMGAIPVSMVFFLLAFFQHDTILSSLTAAAILYVTSFGAFAGFTYQVFSYRRLRVLQQQ